MSRVVHFEIHAKDPDKMQKFYEDAFGWKMKEMGPEFGNYRVIDTGKEPMGINGGMNSVPNHTPQDGQPINAFVCIVGVDDIEKAVKKVEAAGGKITEKIMDMPTVGKLAYAKDPEGNLFGIIQPAPMPNQM